MTQIINDHCPICHKRFFFERDKRSHRCNPVFWIYSPDYTDVPSKVRADDAQSAAELWAQSYDQNGEYIIIEASEVELAVMTDECYQELNESILEKVDSKDWRSESKLWGKVDWDDVEGAEVYTVYGEVVPEYTASLKR